MDVIAVVDEERGVFLLKRLSKGYDTLVIYRQGFFSSQV